MFFFSGSGNLAAMAILEDRFKANLEVGVYLTVCELIDLVDS